MSRNGVVLPIPDDPAIRQLIDSWPDAWTGAPWPRSLWLTAMEVELEMVTRSGRIVIAT